MSDASSSGSNFTWRELVAVLVVVLVLLIVASQVLPLAREKARRVNCAGGLKSFGLAELMYSGDNAGFFPIANAPGSHNFEPLNTAAIMADGKVYACPSAAEAWTFASHSNYRYRGSGLMDDNNAATGITIAYDTSGNHPQNHWMNALFMDGHVEGARPDGSKSIVIPAIPPRTPAIVIEHWNLNN